MSKTVILDSSPTASINFPDYAPLNVSPPLFPRKHRGQPLLGQRQAKYTHFVPMRDESSHVKDLLGIQDTEISEPKPIQGYQELLKAEKVLTGEAKTSSAESEIADASFKNKAKEYLQTPNTYAEDSYEGKEESDATTEKNDSRVATIISAAEKPKPRTSKPKNFRKSTPSKKKKKMKAKPKSQKLKNFRIVQKKKKA